MYLGYFKTFSIDTRAQNKKQGIYNEVKGERALLKGNQEEDQEIKQGSSTIFLDKE